MPWLINGKDDRGRLFFAGEGDSPFQRVIYQNHDELLKFPAVQFKDLVASYNVAGIDERRLVPFWRAQSELGNVYYRLLKSRKTMPARAGFKWYCDRFKRILEEIEPGKHHFVPIDIRLPDGETPWPEPYWYWRCENFIDAIVPDIGDGDPLRSKGIFWNATRKTLAENSKFVSLGKPVVNKIPILNRTAIARAHAWSENGDRDKFMNEWVFLSDEFVDRLADLGAINGLCIKQVQTTDYKAVRE